MGYSKQVLCSHLWRLVRQLSVSACRKNFVFSVYSVMYKSIIISFWHNFQNYFFFIKIESELNAYKCLQYGNFLSLFAVPGSCCKQCQDKVSLKCCWSGIITLYSVYYSLAIPFYFSPAIMWAAWSLLYGCLMNGRGKMSIWQCLLVSHLK